MALTIAAAVLGVYLAEREDDVGVPTVEIERDLGLSVDDSTEAVPDSRTGEVKDVDIRVLDADCARTIVPPTSHWRSGESRDVLVSLPPLPDVTVYAFVEGRDMGKRQLVLGTAGGASYRWPLRKAEKMSAASEWRELFPGVPNPTEVAHAPMKMTTLERHL